MSALPPLSYQVQGLGPNLRRLYTALCEKAGEIVPYPQLENLFGKRNRTNLLRVYIYQLRKRGIRIDTISNVGYRLKPKRKKPVQVCNVSGEAQNYATEIQDAIHVVMRKYAEDVGFESQIAIMGVAIGSILHQLPSYDRDHFTKVLISNVKDAPEFSTLQMLQ